ncbi:MAG TPA: hypothetical protein VF867_00190 [Arthrobacter sp.]
MADQIKRPLPESLMKAIRATVESADLTPTEKFEAVVLMSHGYGLFSAAEALDPTVYAIPQEQWAAISEMLMTMPDGDVGKVNMALDWMNVGPSSYEEAIQN